MFVFLWYQQEQMDNEMWRLNCGYHRCYRLHRCWSKTFALFQQKCNPESPPGNCQPLYISYYIKPSVHRLGSSASWICRWRLAWRPRLHVPSRWFEACRIFKTSALIFTNLYKFTHNVLFPDCWWITGDHSRLSVGSLSLDAGVGDWLALKGFWIWKRKQPIRICVSFTSTVHLKTLY